MKRYAVAFGLFGFLAAIVVGLVTEATVGAAIGRGVLFGVGFAVTSAIQSSTATAMMVAAFAGQGLIGGAAATALVLSIRRNLDRLAG